ncbi:MAG TPA: thiolase domain-containing protein, partial [Acidobacteriota bacterium]
MRAKTGLRRVAAVGAGMTKFMRRALETPKELTYGAAAMALESAQMRRRDIDSVVLGTAPDAFDGIHMNAEYLSDGAGGFGLPTLRGYVGGGTGVFSIIQGWYMIASGVFDT